MARATAGCVFRQGDQRAVLRCRLPRLVTLVVLAALAALAKGASVGVHAGV